MNENSENIKERMFRKAARLWGLPDYDNESEFDPLVTMLISACASEIENISREVHETQIRVTEKLIEIMSPEINMGVLPSHSLACACPADKELMITPFDRFYVLNETPGKRDTKQLFFTPAGHFKLVQGSLVFMLHQGGLVKFDPNLSKTPISKASYDQSIGDDELWLALSLPNDGTPINDIAFCFDYRSTNYRSLFYYLIKNAKWFANNEQLNSRSGLRNFSDVDALYQVFNEKAAVHRTYLSHVHKIYNERFTTVDLPPEHIKAGIPKELEKAFERMPKFAVIEAEKLVWLKVVLPQAVNPELLNDVNCGINIFPIANITHNNKIFKSRKFLNIFALNDESLFFDIESIEDSEGKTYLESKAEKVIDIEDDYYIIRGEGVESFDTRMASEHISHLIEKLKNESAAFNFLDKITFNNDLKTMHQIMSRLEMRLDKLPQFVSNVYLFIKIRKENVPIYITYWSTQGDRANGIKPLTQLHLYNGSIIQQGTGFLVSSTLGGRSKMEREDRINAYKKALLSRDKIISAEDIKAFCRYKLGDRLKRVEIEKGIVKEFSAKGGFTRTIDLHIQLDKKVDVSEDLRYLCKDILVSLEEKSASVFPFRFFINQQFIDV
jgi:hypothetical protein